MANADALSRLPLKAPETDGDPETSRVGPPGGTFGLYTSHLPSDQGLDQS